MLSRRKKLAKCSKIHLRCSAFFRTLRSASSRPLRENLVAILLDRPINGSHRSRYLAAQLKYALRLGKSSASACSSFRDTLAVVLLLAGVPPEHVSVLWVTCAYQ